jgi:hypothetical protein
VIDLLAYELARLRRRGLPLALCATGTLDRFLFGHD